MRVLATAILTIATTGAAHAAEVNVYSHRQPELVQPLFDAFETAAKAAQADFAAMEDPRV